MVKMKYDFGPAEDKIIDGVGIRGLLIGILLIVIAVVDTVHNVLVTGNLYNVHLILSTVQNVLVVVIAIAFILPFADYRQIAKTEGKDIDELMEGMEKMTAGFLLIIIATILTIITEIVRLAVTL
ncbi:hypothetical protein EU546_04400 [Candidatus Thorarchaeota archaeon]|nr:MAG: hypothetical protein EU546_04400 [Candidatus Thorarchaeota archaeon]